MNTLYKIQAARSALLFILCVEIPRAGLATIANESTRGARLGFLGAVMMHLSALQGDRMGALGCWTFEEYS